MLEINQLGLGAYLCVLSVLDIWKRRLPVWLLIAGAAMVVAVRICMEPSMDVMALAGGAVGVVFLIVSKVTEEGFGYGDSLLILIMGVYLGFWNLLGVLVGAFLLSSMFAIVLLIRKGFDRNTGYPFVPFLLIAYLIWLCVGGI